jgi:hypothetical protein
MLSARETVTILTELCSNKNSISMTLIPSSVEVLHYSTPVPASPSLSLLVMADGHSLAQYRLPSGQLSWE